MDGPTEHPEAPPFRERFLDLVCGFQAQIFYLFGIEIVFLAIAVFSLVFADPGGATYAILTLDFIIIAATLLPTVLILYKCSHRDM